MTNEIQYTVEWTIKKGSLDAFKALAKKITTMVNENEPGMMGYQWYFNKDQSKGYTTEWHASSDSLMAHLKNVEDVLPDLLGLCDVTRFEVFGNPSAEVTEALSGLGAEFFSYHIGFTRTPKFTH